MSRKSLGLLLCLLLSVFIYAEDRLEVRPQEEAVPSLGMLLIKAGDYCDRLENAVLDFVCQEEIAEHIDMSQDDPQNPSPFRNNKFIYDYQFIRKGSTTNEIRVLLEENGVRKNEKNAELKTRIFYFRNVLYGPIDLLSWLRQLLYDYKLLLDEGGEEFFVIEAIPKPDNKQEHIPYGKIWLSKKDFSICKIEWNPKTAKYFSNILERAEYYKSEPKVLFVTEFSYEKNGIKFPSRHEMTESYILADGQVFKRSRTKVIYREYKFFTVETTVKH